VRSLVWCAKRRKPLNHLRDYAHQILGSCELLEDSSWGHHMSAVLRLRDASGAEWFLKCHRDRARYDAELTAYRTWVAALKARAPRLRAFDESLQAMIVSALPGRPASWPAPQPGQVGTTLAEERAVHRAAGETLRRLHDAQPAIPWPDFAADKMQQFNSLGPAVATLLTRRQLDAARTEIARLAAIPPPPQVPCHHDYTPRNWLVHSDTVYVFDFEWSGPDAWVADLARLYLGIWPTRPDLQEAVLQGYGRHLAAADREALHGCAVLTGVWLLSKAHETRQRSFEDGSRKALLRLIEPAS
jgi:Ser/Thr protein kinase RdoA (MazF antagonist)